jgi:hypothetical protein
MAQESWYLHSSAVPEHEQRLSVSISRRPTSPAMLSTANDLKAHQERLRTYHHVLQQRPNGPRRYVE